MVESSLLLVLQVCMSIDTSTTFIMHASVAVQAPLPSLGMALLMTTTRRGRARHWSTYDHDWYGHAEWLIDDLKRGLEDLRQQFHAEVDSHHHSMEFFRNLTQEHEDLQANHRWLREAHDQLQEAHDRTLALLEDRGKDLEGVMARLTRLEDTAQHGHVVSSASSAPPTCGVAPGPPPLHIPDRRSIHIAPQQWCYAMQSMPHALEDQVLVQGCRHSRKLFCMPYDDSSGVDDDTYVSAADVSIDKDKLWDQCRSVSTCFEFDCQRLWRALRARPQVFMKFHNPKSSGYFVVLGCRVCGKHTPQMMPQWETGLPKYDEAVKCAFREILSYCLTWDGDELTLDVSYCTHAKHNPGPGMLRTRRAAELFPLPQLTDGQNLQSL